MKFAPIFLSAAAAETMQRFNTLMIDEDMNMAFDAAMQYERMNPNPSAAGAAASGARRVSHACSWDAAFDYAIP